MDQLSIPVFYKDREIYDKAEVKKPIVGVIANTYEILEEKGEYPAILEFIVGGIQSFQSINGNIENDKSMIRAICRRMSYIAAEVIAIKIMLLVNPDDYIEGVYECPRCHKQIITGNDEDEDTRDKISNLDIADMEEDNYYNNIIVELERPVRILHAKTNEILEEINSIELRFPTIDDCIVGMQKYPAGKDVKRQFAIYSNALEKINGEKVEVKYKKTWGEFILNNMDTSDIEKISNEMQKYGIKKSVQRTCRHCGKVWESAVNTSNFFASGLQSV